MGFSHINPGGGMVATDYDADLPTFSLPADTDITAWGRTLVNDANAAAGLATLGAAPTASPALTGAATLVNATTGNALTIDQNANIPAVENTNAALFVENTGGSGTAFGIYTNSASSSAPLAHIEADNVALAYPVLQIKNKGTAAILGMTQYGVMTTNQGAVALYSGAVQDGSGTSLLKLTLDNASSTANGINLKNVGTGNAIYVDQNGNGTSIEIDSEATTADAVNIAAVGTGAAVKITQAGTGEALEMTGETKSTGSIGFTQQTATGDGTTTVDWKLGNKMKFTFGAFNETFTFTAPTNACSLLLVLVQDGTGSRTVTWPATVKWPAATAPTLTTTAAGVDIVSMYWDGTNYHAVASLEFGVPA